MGMVRQVDEDAVAAARAMRGYEKRRERIALEEKQGTINILDAASSELTGLGLKAKVLSEDEVELTWSTDDEEANRGFLIERKAVGYSDWDEVAAWQPATRVQSARPSRTTLRMSEQVTDEEEAEIIANAQKIAKKKRSNPYSYIDATVSEGEWLYRIVAEQSDNSRAIVCQVGVSVENSGQQLQTKLVVGGFAALVLGALAAGALLDPIKG